jgi:hypothetical protein
VGAVFAAGLAMSPATATTTGQPPMNDFDEAFYNCDDGVSFMLTYDDNPATKASMTTNTGGGRKYQLTRGATDTGAQFEGEGVRFWTDGKTVRVEGTAKPFRNCKLKAG